MVGLGGPSESLSGSALLPIWVANGGESTSIFCSLYLPCDPCGTHASPAGAMGT